MIGIMGRIMPRFLGGLLFSAALMMAGCNGKQRDDDSAKGDDDATGDTLEGANVEGVTATGDPGDYTFGVTLHSPDTGCEQYADWWEVVSEEGALIYRRVLLHSHVGEQPFVRSGGPVGIEADTAVWVRAHMNTEGYGGAAFRGSVREGFREAELSPDFAADLADEEPLPDGCAF